jgi:hypothetical protein
MKPKNMKSVTRTRTSPDQKDSGLGFDGLANGSGQGPTKNRFAGNQHGGAAEGNFGRAAANLVGNTGRTANEGPKRPPRSSVPAFEAAKKKLFDGSFNAGGQDRTPGGTRAWEPIAEGNFRGNSDRITEGRGPTKGNKQ